MLDYPETIFKMTDRGKHKKNRHLISPPIKSELIVLRFQIQGFVFLKLESKI